MRAPGPFAIAGVICLLATAAPGWSQDAGGAALPATGEVVAVPGQVVVEEKPAPYDERLMRLSEILGSVHYLRNLCKGSEDGWRKSMQELIDLEAANEPKRRSQLIASFNRGYRTFASVYVKCTGQALTAEQRYRAEGATLATEIIARYGN